MCTSCLPHASPHHGDHAKCETRNSWNVDSWKSELGISKGAETNKWAHRNVLKAMAHACWKSQIGRVCAPQLIHIFASKPPRVLLICGQIGPPRGPAPSIQGPAIIFNGPLACSNRPCEYMAAPALCTIARCPLHVHIPSAWIIYPWDCYHTLSVWSAPNFWKLFSGRYTFLPIHQGDWNLGIPNEHAKANTIKHIIRRLKFHT